MPSITLTLPDMHCGGCVSTVTRIAQRLDPAAQLTTDLQSRTVQVDGRLAEDALRAALIRGGFPPA